MIQFAHLNNPLQLEIRNSSVANAFAQHFCGVNSKYIHPLLTKKTTLLQSEFEPCTELVFDAPLTRDELAYALRSLNSGIVPAEWRTSIIIPIHKKGKDPNMSQNYRPISLTSIAGKAMEKIVVRRLNYYLETNGFIAKEQAGFRSSRSTNQHVALLS
ncbi:uncharacterized protein CEXT_492401 [Caerostris extrusa]|uniref:Reverse transcriptase domain-containing protein n=1 Tax=Caerostris extrusa TaxID=172846 RepID=A0AAV4RN27_CAEEX|nr:uncharacterized protein CEXT_492401 [Caerostris extrusa]